MVEPSPNTVDELMNLDPLSLSRENIDDIVAYHRKARSAASGPRPKKDSGPKVDISEVMRNLGGAPTSTAAVVRRR